MANRKGGDRRRSRSKMTKHSNARGKFSIRSYLKTFKIGDKVQLIINPDVQKGTFPIRFHGKQGTVVAQQGKSYFVEVRDQAKKKKYLAHPTHLKRL